MNERLPINRTEVPKATNPEVDIELDLDPSQYIVGTPEKQADQGVMVGENLIKPATSRKEEEHVFLPIGEEETPINTDIYNHMVGGPSADTDQARMVGENLIKPSTAGRQEHIYLPIGEEKTPINTDIYHRMVGGKGNERPDISV